MPGTIPVGTHEVRVVETYLSESKEKKTPCLVVVFEDESARRISHSLYLSEKAMPYTLDTLTDVLGWDVAADDFQMEAINGTDRLLNRECQIVVDEEQYEGKTFLRVKYVNAKGYVPGAPQLDDDAAKRLGAELRQRIIRARGPQVNRGPGPSKPAPAAKSTEDFDKSLPF